MPIWSTSTDIESLYAHQVSRYTEAESCFFSSGPNTRFSGVTNSDFLKNDYISNSGKYSSIAFKTWGFARNKTLQKYNVLFKYEVLFYY